eukprot:365863-Chlamydomonas_euryale.AAC.9
MAGCTPSRLHQQRSHPAAGMARQRLMRRTGWQSGGRRASEGGALEGLVCHCRLHVAIIDRAH